MGQLGWFEGLYRFGSCWQAGIRGEALSYDTSHGNIFPIAQTPTYSDATTTKISWQSAQIAFLIGRVF